MKYLFLIATITISLFSCKQEGKTDKGEYVYLGGEVISPIEDFVVLKQSEKVIDTVKLDSDNRFVYKFENLKPNLYTFSLKSVLGDEFQFVLLEPNDSIMFRLNTTDFDESLVFTGKGAKKNNYLINLFLEGEAIQRSIYEYSKQPVEEFLTKMDSLRDLKQEKLDAFETKFSIDKASLFHKVAQANIDYGYYMAKEMYPFRHFGYKNIKKIETLPRDFYSYHSDINYNDDFLKEYFSYFDFLRRHIDNLALVSYLKESENCVFDPYALSYNLSKLHLIDSLIDNSYIKNRMLFHNTVNFLDRNNNLAECEKLLESYYDKSGEGMGKKRVKEFAESVLALRPGTKAPSLKVLDINGNVKELESKVNKPTVVYFWTQEQKMHFKEATKKVKAYKEKYPNITFISINVDEGNTDKWKKILEQHSGTDVAYQYQITDWEAFRKGLALHSVNKVVLLDKNYNIIDGNANMFNYYFSDQLKKLVHH